MGVPQLGRGARLSGCSGRRSHVTTGISLGSLAAYRGDEISVFTYFAACELAYDRDHDCVYLMRTYRLEETTPIIHAATLRTWGKHLRWAWPRDGRRRTLEGAGIPLMERYRDEISICSGSTHSSRTVGKRRGGADAVA